MATPFLASFAQMITAMIAGWIVVEKTDLGLDGLFGAIALGIVVYGCWFAGFSSHQAVARERVSTPSLRHSGSREA